MKHVTLEIGKWAYRATEKNIAAAKSYEANQREIKRLQKEWVKNNIDKTK